MAPWGLSSGRKKRGKADVEGDAHRLVERTAQLRTKNGPEASCPRAVVLGSERLGYFSTRMSIFRLFASGAFGRCTWRTPSLK